MAQGANRVAMIWATASELVALDGRFDNEDGFVLSARPVLESDPGHGQNSQILPTPPNYVS